MLCVKINAMKILRRSKKYYYTRRNVISFGYRLRLHGGQNTDITRSLEQEVYVVDTHA